MSSYLTNSMVEITFPCTIYSLIFPTYLLYYALINYSREAVRGLPGWVTDCTAVDASSVRTRLSRSVLAFLRRPQVPPPDPHPCPPSLDLRRDERTLDEGTPSLATSVVCPVT